MVNYGEAIKRPFSDLKKLLIGIVLSWIPIVNFISVGYILENSKTAMKKKYELSEWKNWGDLFVKGLLMVVISLIYMIPALIVFFLTIGAAVINGIVTGGNPLSSLAVISTLGIGLVVFAILAIIASYIIPSAVLNYINKNKFAAGFALSEITKKAFRGEYFAAWLIGGLYTVAIAFVLSWIPWIGAGIASFITSMTFYTMVAEAWASSK